MLGKAEKYLMGAGRVGWPGFAALALHWLVGHDKAATRLFRSLRAVAVRDAPIGAFHRHIPRSAAPVHQLPDLRSSEWWQLPHK